MWNVCRYFLWIQGDLFEDFWSLLVELLLHAWRFCINYKMVPYHLLVLLAGPLCAATVCTWKPMAGLTHWFPNVHAFTELWPWYCPSGIWKTVGVPRVSWSWRIGRVHLSIFDTREVFWASGNSRKIIALREWSDMLASCSTQLPISLWPYLGHILFRTHFLCGKLMVRRFWSQQSVSSGVCSKQHWMT